MRAVWLAALVVLTGCARPTPGVTELSYSSPYSPSHPFSRADQRWMDWVHEQSGGTLRIKAFWGASVTSSEHAMIELRHGVADIALITPIYARGGTHLLRAQAGFYVGMDTFEQQTAFYRCLAELHPQFDRELRGLKTLAVQGGNLPGIITRDRPVRTLDDLRGLRLRAPSELLSVLEHFGADPVDMPMGEVYSALAKGVLDGVVAPADTLRSLHFAEVAKYFNTIKIPRGAYAARAMGLKRWQQLTDQQRALLERSTAVWERALAEELKRADAAGFERGREFNVQFHEISAADQERFDRVYAADSETRAAALARYGIDGLAVFRDARATAAASADSDRIHCTRAQHDSTT